MTPFVGSNFNVTRAGIHADGLMKDAEIYNIFDTEKILNRPAEVAISNTSGLAGIAYWINKHYNLPEFCQVTKKDDIVIKTKEIIDNLYSDGRTTLMGDDELCAIIDSISPNLNKRAED
jgi:isopropylmalate/homocitrate/citramalate synthase